MTVLDLIKGSLRAIGAVGVGEPVNDDDASVALEILNQLLASWSTESLNIYKTSRNLYSATANKATYVIGPGSTDWDADRPNSITRAGVVITTTGDPWETPLHVENVAEYARVIDKSTKSTYPSELYYDFDAPSGSITLWPVPTSSCQIALYTPKQISQVDAVTDDLDLPPAYARALRLNLAVELAPDFSRPVTPALAALAVESKATMKRANIRPHYLRCDPASRGNSGGHYNIYTNGFNR